MDIEELTVLSKELKETHSRLLSVPGVQYVTTDGHTTTVQMDKNTFKEMFNIEYGDLVYQINTVIFIGR